MKYVGLKVTGEVVDKPVMRQNILIDHGSKKKKK